jgi:hypothetical protein
MYNKYSRLTEIHRQQHGPCFSLSHSNFVHPHGDFSLLGLTDLLPQELGLVIKEFVQGDEVGNYVV